MEEPLIRFSWASFARKNPLSSRRSVPTTDNATWCPTPAVASLARRLRVDVSKNFSTAASSHEGELVTSTTTQAPFSASASPSPVMLLTPVLGDATTASCPCSRSFLTSFDPMSPVPPMTTIFMIVLSFLPAHFQAAGLTLQDRTAHAFVTIVIRLFSNDVSLATDPALRRLVPSFAQFRSPAVRVSGASPGRLQHEVSHRLTTSETRSSSNRQ